MSGIAKDHWLAALRPVGFLEAPRRVKIRVWLVVGVDIRPAIALSLLDMNSSSGGSLSPTPSIPLSMPQSSPVFGCQPHPTVSRNPDANTDRALPSRVARNIVAFSGLGSAHSLQVEPTEM